MNTQQHVLANFKVSGNLPSMPQVLVQLLDSCQNPDVDIQTIAQIVDKDAALSAKVMQLVNSAFIGARRAIRDIEQAVVYLGINTVRNLVISISVQQVFRPVKTNGLLSVDRFWFHSCHTALIAQNIAKAVQYPDPSEAYLAGLLHDIGKLILWMAFPGSYAPLLLKGIRCHDARLAFLEEEKLQINHCQAGAWLCEEWHFPKLIADAIRFHHHAIDEVRQTLPLTKIICLADLLSHSDPDSPECQDAAQQLFPFSREDVPALVEGIEEQIEELAGQLGIHIPRLSKTSFDREPESEESHKETTLGLIHRIRDISQLSGLLDNLLRSEDLDDIVLAVEQGMKILFSEERCLLLLPDALTGRLAARPSQENSLSRETEGLVFDAKDAPNSLLAQAIQAGLLQYTFKEDSGKPEPPTLFDAQLQHLLGTDGMVAVPLRCHAHLEGLFLIGLMQKSFRDLKGQTGVLQLMANQAAVALHLERTRREQAQQVIQERLQAATMVARKIGHEINNPLATLRNYLHVLERKASQGQEIAAEISILSEEMERLARITRGLEDLAGDNEQPHMRQVDLQQVLEKTLAPLQASLPPESQVKIVLIGPETPVQLTTDPGFLQQILLNLVKNGLEAIQNQGMITVRTEVADSQVQIHVEDDGPGIAPEQREELFKAGFSTKNSVHRGLGLSIAASLARQMQGTLRCNSSSQKTIFTLSLPV